MHGETADPGGKPDAAKRILFVDGDPTTAGTLTGMLDQMGYDVQLETSGIDAFNSFYEGPSKFDLVITDQGMPDISGLLLAQRLIRIRADVPIILMTGLDNEFQSRARGSGICEFAKKPITQTELAEAIRRALSGRKQEASAEV
jgi:DNA-binding response OmpR family regulator